MIEKVLSEDKLQIERELVLKKENIYIPKNKMLRIEIIYLHLNIPAVGHKE